MLAWLCFETFIKHGLVALMLAWLCFKTFIKHGLVAADACLALL